VEDGSWKAAKHTLRRSRAPPNMRDVLLFQGTVPQGIQVSTGSPFISWGLVCNVPLFLVSSRNF